MLVKAQHLCSGKSIRNRKPNTILLFYNQTGKYTMFRYVCYICFFLILFHFPAFGQGLTLERAVEKAKANNPEIMKARQELKAAKADFWEGISPENPKLFIEFEGIPRSRHSLSEHGERKVGIVQELEFPLAYVYKGRWYRSEKNRKMAEFSSLENEVISSVKKKFFQVLLLQNQLQLYQEITGLTKELYRKAKIRVEAGESPRYDALKVKVDLAEVENRELAIQKELDVARKELALLIGRKGDEFIEVEGNLDYLPITLNLDSLKYLAQKNHPFLKEMSEHLNLHKTERNLAWIGLMPNFEVRYFQHEFQYEPLPKSWGAEIGLSVPLFFFMKDQSRIRSSHYRVQAARWNFELEKRKILFKIEDAYSKLLLAEKQVQNYQENVLKEVEELVRIATRSYEEGEMGYLEVAEALRTLNRVKAGYSEALYEYLSAQAELERSVGITLFHINN